MTYFSPPACLFCTTVQYVRKDLRIKRCIFTFTTNIRIHDCSVGHSSGQSAFCFVYFIDVV